MSLDIQHFPINRQGRDFAVGDIHGCFTRLQKALKCVSFNPKTDRLFSVGDLVDRGPESNEVLDWLSKPWFFAIRGNHEEMVIWAAAGEPNRYTDHAAQGGDWFYKLTENQQKHTAAALDRLPYIIEIQTENGPVMLAHADFPYDDWNRMRQQDALSIIDKHYCLWSRDRLTDSYDEPVRSLRAVIHGHTPIERMLVLGNVYFIDTGGWMPDMGYFTLLELGTLKAYKGPANGTARFSRLL